MMKRLVFATLLLTVLFVTACQPQLPPVQIDRQPGPASWDRGSLSEVPMWDADSDSVYQIDFRATDLSNLDLTSSLTTLLYADFDDRTTWPPAELLPSDFDWQHIMELGKNPGLGVRELHGRGITGKGVSIAIIDQPLLVQHQEYADQLRLYEEINVEPFVTASMHGPAVASIAVGKSTGVAPQANLFYIMAWAGDQDKSDNNTFTYNFVYYAQAIDRILEINETLPEGRKIRVIAMQVGWDSTQLGYEEITTAVKRAKEAGMFIVCSSIEDETIHGFRFNGLGRDPFRDPDSFDSYEPGLFWANSLDNERLSSRLLVPMDSRTTASPHAVDEYVFYRAGGWSWAIPYIAGVYALSAQVDPEVTPEIFWSTAWNTSQPIEVHTNDTPVDIGRIIDPVALIDALQQR